MIFLVSFPWLTSGGLEKSPRNTLPNKPGVLLFSLVWIWTTVSAERLNIKAPGTFQRVLCTAPAWPSNVNLECG